MIPLINAKLKAWEGHSSEAERQWYRLAFPSNFHSASSPAAPCAESVAQNGQCSQTCVLGFQPGGISAGVSWEAPTRPTDSHIYCHCPTNWWQDVHPTQGQVGVQLMSSDWFSSPDQLSLGINLGKQSKSKFSCNSPPCWVYWSQRILYISLHKSQENKGRGWGEEG